MDNGDKRIYNLTQSITKSINESNLPAGVVYYVLKDVLSQVNDIYMQSVYGAGSAQEQSQAADEGAEE